MSSARSGGGGVRPDGSRDGRQRAALSVVLLSSGEWRVLESAVKSIVARCGRMGAEIVVVRSADAPTTLSFARYPFVRVISASATTTLVQARALAMNEVDGDIVVIRSDHDVRDARWLDAYCQSVTGQNALQLDADEDWETLFAASVADSMVERVANSSTRSESALSGRLLAPEIPRDSAKASRDPLPRDRRSGEQTPVSREL